MPKKNSSMKVYIKCLTEAAKRECKKSRRSKTLCDVVSAVKELDDAIYGVHNIHKYLLEMAAPLKERTCKIFTKACTEGDIEQLIKLDELDHEGVVRRYKYTRMTAKQKFPTKTWVCLAERRIIGVNELWNLTTRSKNVTAVERFSRVYPGIVDVVRVWVNGATFRYVMANQPFFKAIKEHIGIDVFETQSK